MKKNLKTSSIKRNNPDAVYQVFWTKKFQNNFYDNLMDNQISKVAERIQKEEMQDDLKEKQFIYYLEDYQREKYQRRRIIKKMQNMRIKNLAEIKAFKGNYKRLVEKIGAVTAVSKNRQRIKHNVVGGWIDINNKQNKKIFESILDEAKVLREKLK